MKPRIVIQFTVTAAQKRAIQRAARRRDVTLSQWLRSAAQSQRLAEGGWVFESGKAARP